MYDFEIFISYSYFAIFLQLSIFKANCHGWHTKHMTPLENGDGASQREASDKIIDP